MSECPDETILNFLLVYDRARGQLLETREFGHDVEGALDAYRRLEQEHAGQHNMDIVLVGSDSLETIKVTHASYFREGVTDIERYLKEFLARVGVRPGD